MNRFGWLLLLAAGVLSLWWQTPGIPYIANDSYQYMDAASEISSGGCICTRLAHFDEQVDPGRFPVAFTHFPPGYPLMIAGVSRLGMPLERAGYVVSAAGYLIILLMFWIVARGLGGSTAISLALGLLFVTNAAALSAASTVATEAFFTALLMGLTAQMVRDINTRDTKKQGSQPQFLLGIAFAAGASYWLRNAGLFLIPVAGLYLLWRAWESRKVGWAAVSLALLAGMMLSIQLRNMHYTGSWRGGFGEGEHHTIPVVLLETVKSFYHLLFGDRVAARADLWSILFVVSLGILLWLSFQYWRKEPSAAGSGAAWFWLGALATVYLGGVMLAALTSIAADFTRYYFPLYPLALAAASAGLSKLHAGVWRTAGVAGAVLAVLVIQGRSLGVAPRVAPHIIVERALEEPLPAGGTTREWLLTHSGVQNVIFSVNGQALHYLLKRPVVSIIEPQYSAHPEDEQMLHALMKQFRSRYLIVFPGMDVPEQDSNPFLAGLAGGSRVPEWLRSAALGKSVSVWECQECGK